MTSVLCFYYAEVVERIRKKISSLILRAKKHPHGLILILLLILLPVTVIVAQQQQEIRQRAFENQATITVTPTTIAAGNPVTVAWTLGTQSTPPQIQVTTLTKSVSRGQPLTISWDYKEQKPLDTDRFEILTTGREQVGSVYLNSCSSSSQNTTPPPSGQCAIDTTNYGNGGYIISTFTSNNKTPASEILFQVTSTEGSTDSTSARPTVGISPTSVTRGGTITIEWRYNGLTPQPTDFLEIFTSSGEHVGSIYMNGCGSAPAGSPPTEGSCTFTTSTIGAGSYLVKLIRNGESLTQSGFTVTAENGFLFIQKVHAQTAFTGGETIQLFDANYYQGQPVAAGKQLYLNCSEKADNTPPPASPITNGDCLYPISSEITPGSYIFRIYAADGVTMLGESPAITITANAAATIPGRIIVTYNTNATAAQREGAINNAASETIQNLATDTQTITPNSVVVTTRPGEEDKVIAAYQQQPGVVEVIPDQILTLYATPNDPLFSQQKGIDTIKVPNAWNSGQGQGVKIAIIDSGIASHPDLSERIGLEKDMMDRPLPPTNPHGTLVAGIAAATYNNNTGIAGTAGKATILNGKADVTTGISLAGALTGIKWAADNGAKVINLSFGNPGPCLQVWQDTIDYAWNKGAIIIVSSGNDGVTDLGRPASCNHVITVGATNTAGTAKTSFSNYGPQVPLAAPGENELTTQMDGSYGGAAGTSIAAPFVAGIAALLFEKYPNATPDFIQQKLFSTAKPLAGFTKGVVDAQAALLDTATPPPSPTGTLIPTTTLIPTPTIVPTTPPTVTACSPRPPVRVQSVKDGDGRLKVTVSVTNNPGFSNTLKAISWNGLVNTTIEGAENATQGSQTSFPFNTQTTTFFVNRQTPGQSTTVSFAVVDDCGEWKTFVGGGPNAF